MNLNGTSKKSRLSNLELLRIFSMMLVMMVHYLPLRSPTTTEVLINNPFKALLNLELHSISIICVHCFILISGYFGIRWKMKSFISLMFQLLFWACMGYIMAKFFIEPFLPSNNTFTAFSFISQMIQWYQARWFVSAYITLYVLSPVINSFIDKSTPKQLLNYIIIFYIFSTLFGWFMLSKEFATGLSAISLIGIYLIGGWLRKSTLRMVLWNKKFDMIGFFLCTVTLTLISALLLQLRIRSSIYGYLNPIVIIESIFLFQFFRKLDIGSKSWVNFLAASAFSAFLLHCHPFLGTYFNTICRK